LASQLANGESQKVHMYTLFGFDYRVSFSRALPAITRCLFFTQFMHRLRVLA